MLLRFSNVDSLDDPSPPPTADDIPVDAADAQVSLDALYRVLHHGESAKGDSHRFSVSADPEDATSRVSNSCSLFVVLNEWVIDCLTPIQQFFSYIMAS